MLDSYLFTLLVGGGVLGLAVGVAAWFRRQPPPNGLTTYLSSAVQQANEREAARVTALEDRVATLESLVARQQQQLIYWQVAVSAEADPAVVARIRARIPDELQTAPEPLVQAGKLTGEAQVQLAALLVQAFETGDLRRLVLGTLGSAAVTALTWDASRPDLADAIVQWAESRDATSRLVQAAQRARPDNLTLRHWAVKYRRSATHPDGP